MIGTASFDDVKTTCDEVPVLATCEVDFEEPEGRLVVSGSCVTL